VDQRSEESVNDGVQQRLQAYCVQLFADRQVRVGKVARVGAGWETEIYSFDVESWPAAQVRREGLIMRLYPGDGASVKAAHEFRSMRQLYDSGYPVPRVFALEGDGSPLGKPFILMERIDGQILWPLLIGSTGEQRHHLLTLFCDLFLRLHRLDWRPFVSDAASYERDRPTYTFVDGWLGEARAALAHLSLPGFERLVDWLQEQRDLLSCPEPSVVHRDFHPYNILLRGDGSPVVIDWAGLQVADARFDLAWTLLLVSAYAGAGWRDSILHEYERLAGTGVDQIERFEAFACARRLFEVTASLSVGAEQLGMRPEAVAMMRQQREPLQRVYDLLQARTGLRVAAVEAVLTSLPPAPDQP
jgi:aminoglycoside phosphotransferase (APT) family kinase protein